MAFTMLLLSESPSPECAVDKCEVCDSDGQCIQCKENHIPDDEGLCKEGGLRY